FRSHPALAGEPGAELGAAARGVPRLLDRAHVALLGVGPAGAHPRRQLLGDRLLLPVLARPEHRFVGSAALGPSPVGALLLGHSRPPRSLGSLPAACGGSRPRRTGRPGPAAAGTAPSAARAPLRPRPGPGAGPPAERTAPP